MKNLTLIFGVVLMAFCVSCTSKYEKVEKQMKMPINCATAEGDIRMLRHEQTHVEDQILQGASAFSPAGLVVGLVEGNEDTKMQVASGDYNRMIVLRIQEIKRHCGME